MPRAHTATRAGHRARSAIARRAVSDAIWRRDPQLLQSAVPSPDRLFATGQDARSSMPFDGGIAELGDSSRIWLRDRVGYRAIQQVPGIGPVIAGTFVALAGSPARPAITRHKRRSSRPPPLAWRCAVHPPLRLPTTRCPPGRRADHPGRGDPCSAHTWRRQEKPGTSPPGCLTATAKSAHPHRTHLPKTRSTRKLLQIRDDNG
jgi:hypothetical protein